MAAGSLSGLRGVAAFVAASAGAAACILTISPLPDGAGSSLEGGATPDASPLPDGGPAEAGPDVLSPDGGDAGATSSLITNGGFEAPASGSLACGQPWGWFQANVALDSTARSGAQACRVCADPDAGVGAFALNWDPQSNVPSVAAGVPLSARAWVRAIPGSPAEQHVVTSIRIYDAGTIVDRCDGPSVIPGSAYVAAGCTFTPSASGVLNVYIHDDSPPDAGECFLVDDVVLTVGN